MSAYEWIAFAGGMTILVSVAFLFWRMTHDEKDR